jgi:hypothetical protein
LSRAAQPLRLRREAAASVIVFTAGIDRWWPKTHGIGEGPVIESVIEPFVGGRWYSQHAGGAEAVVGHVLVWGPARRFVAESPAARASR